MVAKGPITIVDAVFEKGVLRPESRLNLAEHQRVRITIETQPQPIGVHKNSLEDVWKMADQINWRSTGPYPTRDELYDRR